MNVFKYMKLENFNSIETNLCHDVDVARFLKSSFISED